MFFILEMRMEAVGILHVTIVFSEVISAILIAHSMTSLFVSSEFQKKESCDSFLFETFSFAISFSFSISEFQKNESSETYFVRGVTSEEMSFSEGVICSDTTC